MFELWGPALGYSEIPRFGFSSLLPGRVTIEMAHSTPQPQQSFSFHVCSVSVTSPHSLFLGLVGQNQWNLNVNVLWKLERALEMEALQSLRLGGWRGDTDLSPATTWECFTAVFFLACSEQTPSYVSQSANDAFIFEHINFFINSIYFLRASVYYINASSC